MKTPFDVPTFEARTGYEVRSHWSPADHEWLITICDRNDQVIARDQDGLRSTAEGFAMLKCLKQPDKGQ